MSADGAVTFARYAFPPNDLGYCGPDASTTLLEYGHAGYADGGLRALAREFEGAWPYLEVLAGAEGEDDPLAHSVVEAYWLGAPTTRPVTLPDLGNTIDERFRVRAGRSWDRLSEAFVPGAQLCHAFHVFCVSPWVGLMRTGLIDQPLEVIDRCRIRWGTVEQVDGDRCEVDTRPIVWDAGALRLGEPAGEWVTHALDGTTLGPRVRVGDVVSMHWGWVCDRLDPVRLRWLRRSTLRQLALANRQLGAIGPVQAAGATGQSQVRREV
jgi:hypothetical protein